MAFNIENTSELGRKLTIDVPASEVDAKFKSKMNELAPKVNLPGFRPGKVPKSLVEKRYGKSVREEAIGEVVQKSFIDALEESKLKPVGQPEISKISEVRHLFG